MKSGELD